MTFYNIVNWYNISLLESAKIGLGLGVGAALFARASIPGRPGRQQKCEGTPDARFHYPLEAAGLWLWQGRSMVRSPLSPESCRSIQLFIHFVPVI
jgi:hypothetical protein